MTASQGLNGRKLSPHRLADALAGRPAALFGLADRKGAIAPGLDADLIVWDPSVPHVVDEAALHSKAGWSPYHGMSQRGRVSLTLSRGEVVWDGSELHSRRGRGRFLAPTPTASGA
jgi:dihydroorotase-like cyclic amidohydrolase